MQLKLVTIIAEALLEDRLTRDLKRLGAKGYTLTEARGEGSRGVRSSEWEGKNLRIESIVTPQLAHTIMTHLSESYFAHYAVIAYVQDVEVWRGEKYT